jgi:hypothetical protein
MFTLTKAKKLMVLIMLVLLKSSILFSQKQIISNNDTLICFTSDQCKTILKEFNRANYLDTLNKIQSKELSILRVSFMELSSIVELKTNQLKLSQDLSKIKDVEIERLASQKKQLQKEVKRQKRNKIFVLIAGSVSTGLMTYLWITK